jgi:osmoprotectant transport system substrate-binding protein
MKSKELVQKPGFPDNKSNEKTKAVSLVIGLGIILIFTVSFFLFAGCEKSGKNEKSEKKITIGSKGFPENQIVSKIFQFALEDNGFKVAFVDNLDGQVLQSAIENGEIDGYPEYTNTGIVSILKLDPIFDPNEAYRTVKAQYKEKFNILWLEPSGINNTYCLVISRAAADRLGITTISQLQSKAGEIRLAAGTGWEERPDQYAALKAVYGEFNFKKQTLYSGGLHYQVVSEGQEDLLVGYSTDPWLEDSRLLVLEDDKSVWPPYHLTPVIRQEILDAYPEVEGIINAVTRKLDTKTMIRLSAAVSLQHEEYLDVAREFYSSIAH